MRNPDKLNYDNVPGVKQSIKILIKSIIRKFYVKPKNRLRYIILRGYVKMYRLPIDTPIASENGIAGVFLVASYTNSDRGYLKGLINSCEAFEKIILYHDKTKSYNFGYNESLRFQLLVEAAKRHGAKWVLIGSPKTRFSAEFKDEIKPYIEKYSGQPIVISLRERYLWEDFSQFANAKLAGEDPRVEKFFTITKEMLFDDKAIHASQRPINYEKVVKINASRYYLGRFNMTMMNSKASFYRKKDGKDYSYLGDITEPQKHNENLLGISTFEIKQLTGKDKQ